MYKIDSVGSVNGHFSDGDYEVGVKGTVVPAKWLNSVQNEMCNLVEFLGLTLSENDDDQILQGMNSYLNSYFSRQYIEEYIDNVSSTSQEVGPFSVPYKGIVDVCAALSLFDVVGGGNVEIAVYGPNGSYINRAIVPVSAGEDVKIIVRLLTKNDDSDSSTLNFKISVGSSSGCSASGRITFSGSVISKRINYAQD